MSNIPTITTVLLSLATLIAACAAVARRVNSAIRTWRILFFETLALKKRKPQSLVVVLRSAPSGLGSKVVARRREPAGSTKAFSEPVENVLIAQREQIIKRHRFPPSFPVALHDAPTIMSRSDRRL